MDGVNRNENEISSWLKIILSNENLKDLSVTILGSSEKGDGYVGDILFAHVLGNTNDGLKKEYNFVLKCSKQSQKLRETSPVKEAFQNEIFVYDTLLPTFTQFQKQKDIEQPFNSFPKCYGTLVGQNMEVIVLENLKKCGYTLLWNKREPLTRKHIEMVVKEYGKLHAISVAMSDQEPKKFLNMFSGLIDMLKEFLESGGFAKIAEDTVGEVYNMFQNDLEEGILAKWKQFQQKTNYVFYDMAQNFNGLKVIVHGDCWNNNFMFHCLDNDENTPLKVAFLDWQASRLTSPIFDLSYFIFCCISKDDINDLNEILKEYYTSFSNYLNKLGSDPNEFYPYNQFINEWNEYSKYGIAVSPVLLKMCCTNKDEIPDMIEAAESGKNYAEAFVYDIQDKSHFKNRMRHIVKYLVENKLI